MRSARRHHALPDWADTTNAADGWADDVDDWHAEQADIRDDADDNTRRR